ncbi:protein shq1 homolog [Stylonychia lemnae]|uniref:Protein shq1 homolog n=1 Tax=Stylonychia lemnae TaxID=5949 RepID=A0A077ZWB5_STYLE|nr:protein shq1 homolog [Stylonychia lemnae]|eukprot:CDW72736.1 protein shq1 homolog [Stylonychia lemnae]
MLIKYAKIDKAEFNIDSSTFQFYLKPYHLKLKFSHQLKEEGQSNEGISNNIQHYDEEKGVLMCRVAKLNEGEVFEDLDQPQKLLYDSQQDFSEFEEEYDEQTLQMIEAYYQAQKQVAEDHSDDKLEEAEEEEKKQQVEPEEEEKQENKTNTIQNLHRAEYCYGFLNKYFDIFEGNEDTLMEVADLNPAEVTLKARLMHKVQIENDKFDPERYAFDNFDDEAIEQVQEYLNPEYSLEKQMQNLNLEEEKSKKEGKYDDEVNKQILSVKLEQPSEDQQKTLMIQMVDILYAYLYDLRVNGHEPSTETSWNIIKLSSTLSSFIDYSVINNFDMRVKFSQIFSLRRGLTFTFLRSYDLAKKVQQDLLDIFKQQESKAQIMDLLQSATKILQGRYHLYNKCFMYELCYWFQNYVTQEDLNEFATILIEQTESVTKHDLNLNLIEVDEMAQQYKNQESD